MSTMTASAAVKQSASAIEIFRERAEAKVVLIANGYQDLQSAVDELWAAAERDGLVKTFGADEVQLVLSACFARWQYDG
jgi:hypothetical protein